MIKLIVTGQELSIVTQKVVSGTHNYLTVSATFAGDDWTDLRKWVHFTMGEYAYVIPMTDDMIEEDMHLDLTEGTWEVYVHGNELNDDEVTERITTDIKYLYVEAPHDGHPFPPLTPTYEEILSNLIAESKDVWTRLWIAAENGALGGPYFIPSVSEDGVISWTNNGGRDNPESRSIKGPKGDTGDTGVYIGTEEPSDENMSVWINPEGEPGKYITGYEMTGDHTPGTYDRLIFTFSDGTELSIPIYNGADGEGTGDMLKSVYDPNNHAEDIFAAIATAIGALATVAASGSYTDLIDTPTIPVVDSTLSGTSTNAIQNKAVKAALDQKQNTLTVDSAMSGSSTNPVQNKAVKQYVDSKVSSVNISKIRNSAQYIFSTDHTFAPGSYLYRSIPVGPFSGGDYALCCLNVTGLPDTIELVGTGQGSASGNISYYVNLHNKSNEYVTVQGSNTNPTSPQLWYLWVDVDGTL